MSREWVPTDAQLEHMRDICLERLGAGHKVAPLDAGRVAMALTELLAFRASERAVCNQGWLSMPPKGLSIVKKD